MKKLFLVLILFVILSGIAAAKEGHMTLLAVKEDSNGEYKGSVANLYLEIKPGEGRVFIETFPLSKLDTQISTRFAKDIACDYLDKDCRKYDFFYTIKADSSIIGGPSAGAATSILTVAVLEGIVIDENTAITGTINSGGLIGPVGGVKAKIDAAYAANMTKVLIPEGERFIKDEGGFSLDLKDYAAKYKIEIIEVADLTNALYEFSGRRFKEDMGELEIDQDYLEVMKSLAVNLCNRTNVLQKYVYGSKVEVDEEFIETDKEAINLTSKAKEAFDQEKYYTSASYCYGANVNYEKILVTIEDFRNFAFVENKTNELSKEIDEIEIKTITDLEAYIIVKERIRSTEDLIKEAKENFDEGTFAAAIERLYSAESWSEFFGMESKEFEFNRESLRDGCLKKISEAEERYQYAILFFPESLKETKKEIESAYLDLENGDHEICLFKASKAKAEADIILSVIGVEESNVDNLISNKLRVVERVIIEQQNKGVFPILGYSYYEYANSLKESDQYSALLYAEYALELSNLDLYFEEKRVNFVSIDGEKVLLFVLGVICGGLLMTLFKKSVKRKSSNKKR